MNENWKVRKRSGAIYGPVDTETLKRWIQENRISADDYISPKGKEDWKQVNSLSQFNYLLKEVSAEKMCLYCGSLLPAEAVFCTNCGTDLKTGKKIIPQIKKKKKKSPVGIIVILLILAIGGFFAYRYFGASKKERKIINENQQEQPAATEPSAVEPVVPTEETPDGTF